MNCKIEHSSPANQPATDLQWKMSTWSNLGVMIVFEMLPPVYMNWSDVEDMEFLADRFQGMTVREFKSIVKTLGIMHRQYMASKED